MDIRLPELAEDINEAVLTFWHVKEGDSVEKGQDIVEISTDKATFNVPSPIRGTVEKIEKQEGDTVKVGDVLLTIN